MDTFFLRGSFHYIYKTESTEFSINLECMIVGQLNVKLFGAISGEIAIILSIFHQGLEVTKLKNKIDTKGASCS
jgi:hypothetical protein